MRYKITKIVENTRALEQAFMKNGGLREAMTRARLAHRARQ